MSNPSALLATRAKKRGIAKRLDIEGNTTAYWWYPAEGFVGASKTIVMIHGYRGNHHGLEAIVGAIPDANVIVPDLPGFGESEPFAENHSIQRYASWVAAFLLALGPKEKGGTGELVPTQTILLGHSFGTIVVAAAVAEGLAAPAQLILINPVSSPALSGPNRFMTKLTAAYYWASGVLPRKIGNALLANQIIVRGMSVLLAKTKDPELRRWIHREHDENFSNFASRRVAYEGFLASTSHNVGEYAERISQPTLLIIGDRDDITPVADQLEVKSKFSNARLEQISGVGHLIHYETPVLAARFIESFVNGNEQSDASK